MIKSKDISIVVQGAIDKEHTKGCLESIRKHFPEAEIVLSTWENSNVEGLEYDVIVYNIDPGAYLIETGISDNLKRQIVSTMGGIKKASRKYVLKTRADINFNGKKFLKYFDKFNKFESKYRVFEKRIIINSCYTRDSQTSMYLYHPSDWVLFGLKEDIETFFDVPEPDFSENSEYFIYTRPRILRKYAPEQYIFYNCLLKKNKKVIFKDPEHITKKARLDSERYIINNFVTLDYQKLFEIDFLKYNFLDHMHRGRVYSYYDFLCLYKKYCDNDFRFPFKYRWKSDLGIETSINRLNYHVERFMSPIKYCFKFISNLFDIILNILIVFLNISLYFGRLLRFK